jgi:ABC-type cobalamin/Fe3+-siderophores transport systems, ATPase components
MTNAVAFEHLSFAYPKSPLVFEEYAAAIEQGSVFAILGPNGRGKTTLLNVLLGLLRPTGTLRVNGHMALVPQLFQVTFAFTVLDMVLMGRAKKIGLFGKPSKKDIDASMQALERFGIADLSERSFYRLSGGQRQLVILARALVADASILVLDEPTSALDLKNQALVLHWMERLAKKEGLTIIFTTHHPHHALAVADNVLLMLDEKRYYCGNAKEVLTDANLHELYGVPMQYLEFEYNGRIVSTLAPVFVNHDA